MYSFSVLIWSSNIRIMFFIFSYFASCSHYSLQPPFNFTNESLPEIGNWTLRDSATNMKKFIRLTPNYQYIQGGICERVPMYSSDWSFEANLSTGSKYGGVGFSFFYSSTICANNVFNFNGLAVWINTTNIYDDGHEVYLLNSTGNLNQVTKGLEPICKIQPQTTPFLFRITKRGEKVIVDTKLSLEPPQFKINASKSINDEKNSQNSVYKNLNGTYINDEGYILCASQKIENIISKGYFSLFATTQKLYDTHDVHSINVSLLSSYNEPENDNSSVVNRKYLDKYYIFRKQLKSLRRMKMPTMMKYVNISKKSNYELDPSLNSIKLNETDEENLYKDSFPIIKESIERASSTVTALQIKKFLSPIIRNQLQKSTSIIDEAVDMLPEVKELLKDIWNECELSMTEIAANISIQMEKIEQEATEYAKSLMGADRYSSEVFLNVIKNSYGDVNDSPIQYVLATICAVELVAYIIFFIYKRKKTMNFKKIS
ncbi:VIP36-like protein [Tritrichomonas musculus]|uniref:VIP36-like protein n=1 Tax=Tritrichomonas musculus TaxID=1915356 RepID=A0ABR2L1K4_9EUKA